MLYNDNFLLENCFVWYIKTLIGFIFTQYGKIFISTSILFNYINIAFVNSERWLAKSRVDITQCQHGNVGKFLSLYFFVLYYNTNIKHFFHIDIYIYIYSYINTRGNWENSKLCENMPPFGRHVSTQFLVFPISTHVEYNCISTRKMFYIC